MASNAFTVQEGMDIYGSDGEKIGSVSHVYRQAPLDTSIGVADSLAPGELDVETIDMSGTPAGQEMGPAAGAPSAPTGYIEVSSGGVLGIGAKHLYVPFEAVQSVEPGDCATLDCTKSECESLYGTRPAALTDNPEVTT